MKTNYPAKPAKLVLALTLLALITLNVAAQVNVMPKQQSDTPTKLAATVPGEGTSDEGETF